MLYLAMNYVWLGLRGCPALHLGKVAGNEEECQPMRIGGVLIRLL
jgi:hypothetical protein